MRGGLVRDVLALTRSAVARHRHRRRHARPLLTRELSPRDRVIVDADTEAGELVPEGHTPNPMRTALAAATVLAALPHNGVLVPGRSLGGVRLGEPAAQVAAIGPHGVCSGCAAATWYFTYRKFTRAGLAVELTNAKVSAVYTIWQPQGWHTPGGLQLDAAEAEVTQLAQVTPVECPGYSALVHDARGVRTAYYIVNDKLWGFGLMPAGANPCR